jgi:hypothetical protein
MATLAERTIANLESNKATEQEYQAIPQSLLDNLAVYTTNNALVDKAVRGVGENLQSRKNGAAVKIGEIEALISDILD